MLEKAKNNSNRNLALNKIIWVESSERKASRAGRSGKERLFRDAFL